MPPFWVSAGALSGMLGVIFGAFGAHGLKKKFPGNAVRIDYAWFGTLREGVECVTTDF